MNMRIVTKYALATGGLMGLLLLIEHYLGFRTTRFDVHFYTNFLNPIIVLVALALCFKQLRAAGGRISFLGGLKTSLIFGLVCGLVWAGFNYIYLAYLDPEYLKRIRSFFVYIEQLKGHSSLAPTEGSEWTYRLPFRIVLPVIITTFLSLGWGFILSLAYSRQARR
jgi:hypothetical protein